MELVDESDDELLTLDELTEEEDTELLLMELALLLLAELAVETELLLELLELLTELLLTLLLLSDDVLLLDAVDELSSSNARTISVSVCAARSSPAALRTEISMSYTPGAMFKSAAFSSISEGLANCTVEPLAVGASLANRKMRRPRTQPTRIIIISPALRAS